MSKIKVCKKCSKRFRLIDMELIFYQKQGYPEPEYCPICRQKRREALMNPRYFFKCQCSKCGKDIITTFDPKKKIIVYCLDCYREYYNIVNQTQPQKVK